MLPTLALFLVGWSALAWLVAHRWGVLPYLLVALPTAGLFVRLFIVQHDCGHGSFLGSRRLNHAVGAVMGLITMVPYSYWKKTHSIHHGTSSNLDRRGMGDISTLTVREYAALPTWRRLAYRLYRSMPVILGLGPFYQFILKHRLPFDLPFSYVKERRSVILNNLALTVLYGGLFLFLGVRTVLLVQIPLVLIAGAAGVWLFYVQHQFEDAYWDRTGAWTAEQAALLGSSYYHLPRDPPVVQREHRLPPHPPPGAGRAELPAGGVLPVAPASAGDALDHAPLEPADARRCACGTRTPSGWWPSPASRLASLDVQQRVLRAGPRPAASTRERGRALERPRSAGPASTSTGRPRRAATIADSRSTWRTRPSL